MQPLTFYLDWIISGQFAGLCWAQAKGLYAQAGLDVDLYWRDDGLAIVDKVLAGGLCAGSSEDNLIVSGVAAGKELKALGVMLQQSPLVLMTKRSSGIRTLADLPGRRVAMHVDGIRILEAVLLLEGIDRTTVAITEVAFDLDNLARDRFDAVQGYAMSEPLELAAMGIDVHTIPVRHHQLHPYAQVFFASGDCIRRAPDSLRSFLAASFVGWRQAMTHLDEAAWIVAGLASGAVDYATERQVVATLPAYATDAAGLEWFGMMDLDRWARNLESYARYGVTPRQVSVAEVVDDQFLKAIYAPGS